MLGPDQPIHKGRIAYRAAFSAQHLKGGDIGPSRASGGGEDRHIVIYYTKADHGQSSTSSPTCPNQPIG